jgi:hypothetical protein
MEINPNEAITQPGQAAEVYSLVTLDLIDRSGQVERLTLQIVPDDYADFSQGFLGQGTPLACAIQGKRPGSIVPYSVGDLLQVHILDVRPALSAPPPDIKSRRQEILHKAVENAERTSAIIFASSYTGKWGDYDPSTIEEGDLNKGEERTS